MFSVRNDFDSIRSILIERICGAFELAPHHGPAVETHQSGDSAHGKSTYTVRMLRRTQRDA